MADGLIHDEYYAYENKLESEGKGVWPVLGSYSDLGGGGGSGGRESGGVGRTEGSTLSGKRVRRLLGAVSSDVDLTLTSEDCGGRGLFYPY